MTDKIKLSQKSISFLININTALDMLKLQRSNLLLQRDNIILKESLSFQINPSDYSLDESTWEFIKREKKEEESL